MGRISNIPKGFYSASQAIKRLGIPKSTFHDMVTKGQIKKVVPPNKSDGFYPKTDIDKMAKAQEAFMLQYATDASTFEIAEEEDTEGIAELYTELFGGNKESRYNLIEEWYNSNHEMFYVLKQDGLIVGYFGMFPLKHEAIEKIMNGLEETRFRTELLTPKYIIPEFKAGVTEEAFLIIGVKQNVKKSKLYGSRTVSGSIEVLETMAKRGIVIKKLYATSRTQQGIRLSKGMGFKQITPIHEEDNLLRFELDITTTTNPLFKDFQRIAKQSSDKKGQNKSSRLAHSKESEKTTA